MSQSFKKTSFFVTYSRIYAIAFVHGKLYQPSLMFVGEGRSLKVAQLSYPLAVHANTRLGCKCLLINITLTYSRIYTREFVPGKLYQPSLMFAGEARSMNVAPFGFLANTRLGCKYLPGPNV